MIRGSPWPVAAAGGYPLSTDGAAHTRNLLLDQTSDWMAPMMRAIALRAPRIETEQIIGDMARPARRYRIDVPLFDAAHCHLQWYAAKAAG